MLNIAIPMAGAGSRFAQAGYQDPKPLIPIHGVPMIRIVIENLRPRCRHRFIFICQRAHVEAYGLIGKLGKWAPGSVLVALDGMTGGAACTVLAARRYIDNHDALMIANSDQYIDTDVNRYIADVANSHFDGIVMTMTASDPKWSFVGLDDSGCVARVAEKQVISNEATTGIYNFRRGRDFVRAAESMIAMDLRVNGEFYVAPVYNQLIAEGRRIGIHRIGSEHACMHGLGAPFDLDAFLARDLSRRAAEISA